jgi:phosphopantetheinyl transferase (holo-ACP synthase)
MKTCSKCKIEKPVDCFYKNIRYKNGIKGTCKDCDKNTSKHSMKKYRSTEKGYQNCKISINKTIAKDFEKHKWACKKSVYKALGLHITKEEYDFKLKAQDNKCAICNKPPEGKKSLSLDHCHTTLTIRGFLCTNCNLAIGKFKDDLELLNNAINYLRSY